MILLIGGTGYIGSRLYRHLMHRFGIYIMDLDLFGNNVTRYNMNVNYGKVEPSFFQDWEAIILLAGHSSVGMAKEDPLGALINNITNFSNLLFAVSSETKFIYASSSSVYNGLVDASEDDALPDSTNFYDYTKKSIDEIAALSGKPYYSLRFGTVNGGSPNLRTDLMINKMWDTAMSGRAIDVYGSSILRPILGIDDLCSGMDLILDGDIPPGVYNMASFNLSVGEIAYRIARQVGSNMISRGDSRSYDFSINCDKMKSFGWTPIDSVESIVKSLKIDEETLYGVRDVFPQERMSVLF